LIGQHQARISSNTTMTIAEMVKILLAWHPATGRVRFPKCNSRPVYLATEANLTKFNTCYMGIKLLRYTIFGEMSGFIDYSTPTSTLIVIKMNRKPIPAFLLIPYFDIMFIRNDSTTANR